jgi:hypothetical protein
MTLLAVQRILNPRVLSYTTSYDVASNIWRALECGIADLADRPLNIATLRSGFTDVACHVMGCCLTHATTALNMLIDDVAGNCCQVLGLGLGFSV